MRIFKAEMCAASGFCRGLPSAEYILQKCVGERQPKLEIREVYRAVHNADAALPWGVPAKVCTSTGTPWAIKSG